MTLTNSPKSPGRGGGSDRRRLVVLLGVLAAVLVAGLGYVVLAPGGGDTPVQTALPSPRATGSATSGASPSASSDPSGTTSATGGSGARNPFGAGAGARAGGSTGSTGSTATPTAAPTGVTPSPSQTPSGSATPTTSTTTTRLTATITATRTSTATTTVTVTPQSVYVGLYGWTGGGLPIFRVGTTGVAPAVGDTFGTSLVYVGPYTSDGASCASITFAGAPYGLCPGDVVKLG